MLTTAKLKRRKARIPEQPKAPLTMADVSRMKKGLPPKRILSITDKINARRLQGQTRKLRGMKRKGVQKFPLPPLSSNLKKRELFNVLEPGVWSGHRCFIVGGGPSLKDFNWGGLNGELVITINRGFEKYKSFMNVAMDTKVFGFI